MSPPGRLRRKRPCPYCGEPTKGAACPLHRDLLAVDPLAQPARRPVTETELGAGDPYRPARRPPRRPKP